MSPTCLPMSARTRAAASFALLVGLGVAERVHRLERELGVDHQRALVGQEHRAVRPAAVGERVLEFVEALRQSVLDDDLHAALAEGAAVLLVGEHALQRGDLGGELGDVLLRAVDHRQPLVQLRARLSAVCWRVAVIDWLR